jgi:hypothetical protein
MQSSLRCIMVVIWCLLMSVTLLERHGFANMSTGFRGSSDREVVNCFFGALRKDGQIMVNMVPGAAGMVYHIYPTTPVTLNGSSVGLKYLENGMPIVLILNRQKIVDEIQVRPVGGK